MHAPLQRLRVALIVAGLCAMAALSRPAPAQSKNPSKNQNKSNSKTAQPTARTVLKSERDYLVAVDAPDSPLAVGGKVELVLQNGKRMDGLVITEIQSGTGPGTLQTLGVKSSKGKRQKIKANTLARILIGVKSRPLDVLLDPESKECVLLDVARRDDVVAQRLRSRGQRLWGGSSVTDYHRAIDEYKRNYLDKVSAVFPNHAFQLHETEYFLFYTNIPPDQAEGFVADLDRMYVELGKMFGLLKETNIWRGKCVVLAFVERSDFEKCDVQVMGRPPGSAATAQGVCHSFPNGKVVVTCYRGADPIFFRSLLVHETTHAFLHLYRSNVFVPSWLNEGLAEWVANLVVPESQVVPRRQHDAFTKVQTTRSMGGMFNAQGNIEPWQYGLASGLADFLMQSNLPAYGGLITQIKEGATWQEALHELYGLTPEELAAEYGRELGLDGLTP